MIFLKKNYKKIPRNKKTRKSSIFFNRFIVHRFKAPLGTNNQILLTISNRSKLDVRAGFVCHMPLSSSLPSPPFAFE